ncbi:MAG: dihydroneopterin aldolase [Peptococcaceae bacterium]|nr:dihydroneopterin aldolase [Peptococcaceae bacterium]
MKGMRFFGRHGVLPQERDLGQIFEVDVELMVDLKPAAEKDDLELSVSYADVYGAVEEIVTGESVKLLETLAERISARVLRRYGLVQSVRVVVKKPAAPIQGAFEYMAVDVLRSRNGL